MRTDYYYASCGAGKIHACRWTPEGPARAVVQIVHGIAEYAQRYEEFAEFLNAQGYVVVAEDHMGHGASVGVGGTRGCFTGGWFSAVADTYRLLCDTRQEFPNIPYVLLGHSMGSFMVRTILEKYPQSGISAAVICGTGWQPRGVLAAGLGLCRAVCRAKGEKTPSPKLEKLVFGGYNKRVERPRTPFDWLNRNDRMVDEYMADPLCGFTPTAGLMRDLLTGMAYMEDPANLAKMKKDLPVLLIAGGDDPVGNYGAGVRKTAQAFEKAGMRNVSVRIYPLCRHELLNEINREEVYRHVADFAEQCILMGDSGE